jgi:transcriptional regulator with XRE-family HTH domain
VYLPEAKRKPLARCVALSGKTHRQIAAEVGWQSHAMISHLIKGRKNSLSADSAVLLAKALEVDVTDLFVTELSQSPGQSVAGRERKERAA